MSVSNPTPSSADRPRALLVGLAFYVFVSLGLFLSLLGVAWPSMRASFGVRLDALGVLLIATTTGYIIASFSNGRLVARFGVGWLLVAAGLACGAGLWGYAAAPAWGAAVLAAFVLGLGMAAIDSGLNTWAAVNLDSRVMNWLHAFASLGGALGPALMTLIVTSGRSWRYGYAAAGLVAAGLAAAIAFTLPLWRVAPPRAEPDLRASLRYVSAAGTLRLPALWLSIMATLMHNGVSFAIGQWSFSLLTESRSIPPGVAGAWVSAFWASLALGRLLGGFAVTRLGIGRLVRISAIGLVLGCLLIAWRSDGALNLVGLFVTGFAQAPLFPLLMSTTPRRLGAAHAPNAIGFQVSAASLGAAIVPGLIGLLAQRWGLEVFGPILVASAIIETLLCIRVMCSGPIKLDSF